MTDVALAATVSLTALVFTGCRSDMQDQPKMYPQRGATLFADGRSVRPQVDGTVARSQGKDTDYIMTGMIDGQIGNAMPFPLTADVLARGQERFNIYCAPCHSRVGNGKGAIPDRGYYPAASFHSERLRQAPLGYFFKVITEGLGVMPNYHSEVTVPDRWAIAAYIRALQLSQNARTADVPAGKTPVRLVDVMTKEGFPEKFLTPWGITPSTEAQSAPEIPPAPVAVATATAAAVVTVPPTTEHKTTSVAPATSAPPVTTAKTVDTTVASVAPVTPKPAPVAAAPKADAAAGKAIYMSNCVACHQPTRTGLPPVIPSLVGIVERTGAQHVRETVQQGRPQAKPPMPAFTALSAEDINNLIEFLRTAK